jgi:signal transduction histidine kinase
MFWGIEGWLFIPCLLLIGGTLIMFSFHAILYFQYKERIILKYCFYLASISIYLFLDLYARAFIKISDTTFRLDSLTSAVNFIVILGYSSFLMEAVRELRGEFKKIFRLWAIVYHTTVAYIAALLLLSYLNESKLQSVTGIMSNVIRVLFVFVAIVAILNFYPLIKGKFLNMVKWGGIIYLFFMLLVLAAMAAENRQLFGLTSMHYVYLGTFADVLIFSYAMSIKIKESLNKAAQVRHNLSRDLHDEVGATLTGIRMFGQLAVERPETSATNLKKINSYSDEMLNKMSDIVWAINPDNDNIDRMIAKLHGYAASLTTAKDILLDFKIDENVRKRTVNMELRKNIFLISKEAINNAVKYSNCKKISLSLSVLSRSGLLSIEDDGIGFQKHKETEGNGLKNMTERAKESNGKLAIKSAVGEGTKIDLTFNFT